MESTSIYAALAAVQSELKAPKGQMNTFGGYRYRSCEDILEAVKPILKAHDLLLTLSDEPKVLEGWHYIEATAKLESLDLLMLKLKLKLKLLTIPATMSRSTPRQLKKLAMPVGVSRSTPLPWRTLASCCRNHTLAESSITCSASLWKMDVLSWCPPRWWKSSITEGRDVSMKAVLLSIRPEWCDLVVRGKKTIEVRKTRPKLETPFKAYIYCTKAQSKIGWLRIVPGKGWLQLGSAVIGEFTCDKIDKLVHVGTMMHANMGTGI